jgi:hypothetical protein
MFRELSNEEQLLVSGGQSAGEQNIQSLINLTGGLSSHGTDWGIGATGINYIDRDGNGFYDDAYAMTSDGDYYVYDSTTNTWDLSVPDPEGDSSTDPNWSGPAISVYHESPPVPSYFEKPNTVGPPPR